MMYILFDLELLHQCQITLHQILEFDTTNSKIYIAGYVLYVPSNIYYTQITRTIFPLKDLGVYNNYTTNNNMLKFVYSSAMFQANQCIH